MLRPTRVLLGIVFTVVLGYLGVAGWTVASIQLRLWRNRPIADRIQSSLAPQFPGVVLRAFASYERDMIAVTTADPLPDADLLRLQSVLREFKGREQLSVDLLLLMPRSGGGEPLEFSL